MKKQHMSKYKPYMHNMSKLYVENHPKDKPALSSDLSIQGIYFSGDTTKPGLSYQFHWESNFSITAVLSKFVCNALLSLFHYTMFSSGFL